MSASSVHREWRVARRASILHSRSPPRCRSRGGERLHRWNVIPADESPCFHGHPPCHFGVHSPPCPTTAGSKPCHSLQRLGRYRRGLPHVTQRLARPTRSFDRTRYRRRRDGQPKRDPGTDLRTGAPAYARFRPVLTEVLFIDRYPADGAYEPLIGYIPLEQAQAAVDLVGHRLIKVSRVDLKSLARRAG